jgi:hypothetical protein
MNFKHVNMDDMRLYESIFIPFPLTVKMLACACARIEAVPRTLKP